MGRNGGFRCVLCFWGLRPSACLGLGLGHPWVTQASRKRHARVSQGSRRGRIAEVSLFAMKVEKCWVGADISGDQVIARESVHRKNRNLTTDEHGLHG